VTGLLEKMRLSETEKTSIKFGGSSAGIRKRGDPQAVGKVLAEKLTRPESLEITLGKIWWPLMGVECKDLGDNRFLFTFLQGSGKRRALEDGPWMFRKDLVVMAEFDGAKTIDEIEFNSIPIWVRVLKMPLGLINKAAGEVIGGMIGDVLEVDADEDDMAIGQYMRIKIWLDIQKPLMWGVTLDLGDEIKENMKWCPLVYEFIPNFLLHVWSHWSYGSYV